MNSLLGQLEAISCAKKCFLLPSFRESIHKAIKFFSQFCYLVSVNLTYLHVTPPNPYSKGGFVRVCLLVCLFVCLFIFRFLEHKYSFNIKTYNICHVK